MQRCHMLRDDQWELIKDLLPGRAGTIGVTAKDNRLFFDAVLYRNRSHGKRRYLILSNTFTSRGSRKSAQTSSQS